MAASEPAMNTGLAQQLVDLGVGGVLRKMAEHGQLPELRCEMPTCYCPRGRLHFERRPKTTPLPKMGTESQPLPSAQDGWGAPRSVERASRACLCNNTDYGWRNRIRAMPEKEPNLSFEDIAETLNEKKAVFVPPGAESWTAALVRKAYAS